MPLSILYSWLKFINWTHPCNQYPGQKQNINRFPQKSCMPSLYPMTTFNSHGVLFPVFEILSMASHCELLKQFLHHACESHQVFCVYVIFFPYCSIVFQRMTILQFVYPFCQWWVIATRWYYNQFCYDNSATTIKCLNFYWAYI